VEKGKEEEDLCLSKAGMAARGVPASSIEDKGTIAMTC